MIVAATIPFALVFAMVILLARGESANLLSVGAIAFGLIVDATVILVENIFRQLRPAPGERFARPPLLQRGRRAAELRGNLVFVSPAVGVRPAMLFLAAIIIAGFVPLFILASIEGHIFGPMASAYAYAIAGGLIASFTVSPALSALLLPDPVKERETFILRRLRRAYQPVLEFALENRLLTLGCGALLFVLAALAVQTLGLEPKLEEGNLWIRAKDVMAAVVGGSLLAPALILVVLPLVIDLFSRRRDDDAAEAEEAELRAKPAE
jgi:heavy metal efflux system protein